MLALTAVVMLALVVLMAYGIDTAIWFVHGRHLQTQADAAAFAGADVMAQGVISGNCDPTAIKSAIGQYDGSQPPVTNQTLPGNQQVAVTPTYATTYSTSAHNLFDQINQANFENQSTPGDTGLTGNPCQDGAVDVKMTETNLPSFLTPLSPGYINRQARVAAQTVASQAVSPFVLPNIATPTDAAVFVVGESASSSSITNPPSLSSDTILTKLANCADNGNVSPCLSTSNSNATWSAANVAVPFGTTPASLVVAQSRSAITSATLGGVTNGPSLATFCASSGVTCYGTDGYGLAYTRTYTTGTTTFPTQAPIVLDTSVSDSPTDTSSCKRTGTTGLFTGFIASNGPCTLKVSADMTFGTGTNSSCAAITGTLAATLTITAYSGTTAVASSPLNCPNPGSTAAGSATGNWTTSSTLSIAANSGPITFDLTWKRTGGGSSVPKQGWEQGGITTGNNTGQCGNNNNACTNDFKIVQRVFTGAYDQATAATNPSGPIAGAAITNASGELMATPANATASGLSVTIDFQTLYDTTAAADGSVPSGSFQDVAYGTNQGNGLANCGQGVNNSTGPNGFDVQENAIAGLFTCNNYPVEPASFAASQCTSTVCPGTVPGNKFLQWLDGGMASRIYGCPEASHSTANNEQNGCPTNPLSVTACQAHPNYWSTQNQLFAVEANSSDPRLISVMVTDAGTPANGNNLVPVRHYAEFYVTGWSYDPCSGVSVSGRTTSNGLYYVSDDVAPTDAAGDLFLVGHFVHYFVPGAQGSGTSCVLSSIDNCTLTMTK